MKKTLKVLAWLIAGIVIFVCIGLLCSSIHDMRPHLAFLNGRWVEGSPKDFIERSNYHGLDSLGNCIYFPEYDSTGANNYVIVDSIPFEITFETNRSGDITKLTAHAICTKEARQRVKDIWLLQYGREGEYEDSFIYRYVGPHFTFVDQNRYDFNSEPHLYEIYFVYQNHKTYFQNLKHMFLMWYYYRL